jgi:hypothetical protein
MSANTEEKPATNRPEELDEEQSKKTNEESGTPKTVDFSKVLSTAMAQMSSNIRKQPNKRTKREEILFEERKKTLLKKISQKKMRTPNRKKKIYAGLL